MSTQQNDDAIRPLTAQECAAEGEIALRECEIPMADALEYGICKPDGAPENDDARCTFAMFTYAASKFTALSAINDARKR